MNIYLVENDQHLSPSSTLVDPPLLSSSLHKQKLISPDICFQSKGSSLLFPLCRPAIKRINLCARIHHKRLSVRLFSVSNLPLCFFPPGRVSLYLSVSHFIAVKQIWHKVFKVTTRNIQNWLILVPPLDKSGSDTSAYYPKDLLVCVRQAELSLTPATRAFVLEASERETAGWMAMR